MAGPDGTETQVKVEKPVDQETANIAAYARIYRKCFSVAQEIVKDAGGTGDPVEIAGQLFGQFQHDQIELAKQNQLVNYLKTMTRGRI
jgi:hypothetical protein